MLPEDRPGAANPRRSGKRPRTPLEKWLGLITAITSLATAGLGLFAAEVNIQKNKAQATAESTSSDLTKTQDENNRLKQQNNELAAENSSLRATPPPPEQPSPGGSSSATSELLSEMTPLNTNSVDRPKSVMIGTEVYPNSFTLGCSPAGTSVTYPVAGYSSLKARIGLDNNEAGSAAKANHPSVIRVTAEDGRQLGNEFQISLSQPADLSIPLTGAVQATIKCTLIAPAGYYRAAFGDAALSR